MDKHTENNLYQYRKFKNNYIWTIGHNRKINIIGKLLNGSI